MEISCLEVSHAGQDSPHISHRKPSRSTISQGRYRAEPMMTNFVENMQVFDDLFGGLK